MSSICDQDLLKICHLEKRMRSSEIITNPEINLEMFSKLDEKKNENEKKNEENSDLNNGDSFSLGNHKDISFENAMFNNQIDKENDIPNKEDEEKNDFSLQNYLNTEEKAKKTDGKRKANNLQSYYPIFKKLKTSDELSHHKIFADEKNGFSENSNDGFHINSIKNNRKITEYFKKQKNQKNFVQNLIKNDGIKIPDSIQKNQTKLSFTKTNKENLIKNISLRKISFGDSNSINELFIDTASNEKKMKINEKDKEKEKEKPKNSKITLNNSSEKVSNENYKLKDEIRKLNKKLVDKDAILKREEVNLKHLFNENKILSEKVGVYERQIVIFTLNFVL